MVLILISVVASLFILSNQGEEKQTLYLQASKWFEGKVPDEYVDASTLVLGNEIVSMAKAAVLIGSINGPILISDSNPIKPWAEKIIEDSPFNSVNIRTAENEYYRIEFYSRD